MQRSAEHSDVIYAVLKKVAPLDVDVVGEATAKRIAGGLTHQSVEGGHHLDLTEAISLISGIATLAHLMVVVSASIAKRLRGKALILEKVELLDETRAEAVRHEPLRELLAKDPEILSRVHEAIEVLHGWSAIAHKRSEPDSSRSDTE